MEGTSSFDEPINPGIAIMNPEIPIVPITTSPNLLDINQYNHQNSLKRPLDSENDQTNTGGQVGHSQTAGFMADIQKRWEQKKIDVGPPAKMPRVDQSDSARSSTDDPQATTDRPIAAPPISNDPDRKTRGKKIPKPGDSDYSNSDDDKPDPPTPKSDGGSNYEPSSAPSSDSEDVEFDDEGLSEEADSGDEKRKKKSKEITIKKKAPIITALSFLANNKKRQSESDRSEDQSEEEPDKNDDDEGSHHSGKDFSKAKNSFEMLRRLRALREKKRLEAEQSTSNNEDPSTSTDGKIVYRIFIDRRGDSAAPLWSTQRKSSVDENNIDRSVTERYALSRKRQVVLSDDEGNSNSSSAMLAKSAPKEGQKSPILAKKGLKKTVVYSSSSSNESEASADSGDEDDDAVEEVKVDEQPFQVTVSKKPTREEIENMGVQFFNDATTDQLSNIPRCSKAAAEALITYRPFKSYDDLLNKVENIKIKGSSSQIVTNQLQVIEWQNDLDRLLQACMRIADGLQSSVDELLAGNTPTVGQPTSLNDQYSLKPYQVLGLNWLILMHRNNLNAVLADEMGLGKTIQVIAFLAYLKEQNIRGPHIVVVPSSTMDNWLNEFRRWCPTLNILTYYGSLEDRKFLRKEIQKGRQADFDVMLSTYRVITSSVDDRAFFKRMNINYAVFDEAHMLKNSTTARYKSLMKVKAKHRLLLTGTPLQNNLIELVSLLHFVMPTLFRDHTENLKDILNLFQAKNGLLGEYEQEKIEQAKRIMKPFVLRRLKADVLSQLPEKHDRIEACQLTPRQMELYDSLVAEYSASVGNPDSETDAKGMFMHLRKVANHPLLMRSLFTEEKLEKMAKALKKEKHRKDADVERIYEDLAAMNDFQLHMMCKQHRTLNSYKLRQAYIEDSGKLIALDSILPEIKAQGNKVLLFSQFTMVLDILEEFLKMRKYKFLRLDGSTPVVERQIMIDKYNNTPALFAFLLSTRAGGLGINLTSANTIILHDIDYNPYNDKQAEDRCHRVGQTKEVTVIRLIAQNTVDETMLACAQKKLQLEQQITGADQEDDENSRDVESLLKQALKL